jgi:hypothetical protein
LGCLDPNEESPDETQLNTLLDQDEFGDSYKNLQLGFLLGGFGVQVFWLGSVS